MGAINTAEAAIVAKLAASSITALQYEPKQLPSPKVCTLWIKSVDTGYSEDWQQHFVIGQVSWTLRYYVRVMQNEKTAYDSLRTGIEAIFSSLGADRTLGGAVGSCSLNNGSVYLAAMEQQPLLVFEAELSATLEPS